MTKARRVEKSTREKVQTCRWGKCSDVSSGELGSSRKCRGACKNKYTLGPESQKLFFWGSPFWSLSSCQHHQREHYPHHRDQPHLHGRIMMHFSLSWQTTHSLSSLSRSTSLSSWNDILILILVLIFILILIKLWSPDPRHYHCCPSSCQLSPPPADNSSSSAPASPSLPPSPPPPLPPERKSSRPLLWEFISSPDSLCLRPRHHCPQHEQTLEPEDRIQ